MAKKKTNFLKKKTPKEVAQKVLEPLSPTPTEGITHSPIPINNKVQGGSDRAFTQRREKLKSQGASHREATSQAAGETEGVSSEQRTQESIVGEGGTRDVLAQELTEAGVFKPVTQVDIVESEQENIGVMGDIIKSVLPDVVLDLLAFDINDVATKAGVGPIKQDGVMTRTEATIQKSLVTNAAQTGVSLDIDNKIDEEAQVIEQGLGVGVLIGAVAGPIISGTLGGPVSQAVGSDKTIKNLEAAVTNLDKIHTDILRGVDSGALSPARGFEKLNTIDQIMNDLESGIQEAALQSPNVRISLRGREIRSRIFSSREKLQATRGEVAVTAIQRQGQITDPAEITALLLDLQARGKRLKGGS